MTHALPFLMFEGRAEEALGFYIATFPDSELLETRRHGVDSPVAGRIMVARARIAGLEILASDSPISHGFTFTPSFSFFVELTSAEEVDRLAAELVAGGKELMPPGDYGFSRRFAWVQDRFGVSFQLNFELTPS